MKFTIDVYLGRKWIGSFDDNKDFNDRDTLEDVAKHYISVFPKKLSNMKLDERFESSVRVIVSKDNNYRDALDDANFTSKTAIAEIAKKAIAGYNKNQCDIAKEEAEKPPKPCTVSQIKELSITLQFLKSKE